MAIPIVIFDKGFCHVQEGTLLSPPAELFTASQKSFYSLTKPGWQRCPLGYAVFAAYDSLGRKVVIPGIYIEGEPAPKRKFPNYPLKFSRQQIENFARSHLTIASDIREQRDTEFKNLTHDLRAISTEIYHNALAARDRSAEYSDAYLLDHMNLIINSQQMMSLRLDIIDYESGLSSSRPTESVSPFPKIEKVLRCFEGKFRSKKISWHIEGRSFDLVSGPPIFEIVPFVIVENALKYAPHGSEIIVRFQEESNKIVIRFESLGPKIMAKEKEKIFEKGYRGEAVQDSRQSGSGIGLFAAKTIIETHFSGRVFVNQLEEDTWVNGERYWITRFTLVLPSLSASEGHRGKGSVR